MSKIGTTAYRSRFRVGSLSPALRLPLGLTYAWSGYAIMWIIWVSFVVFLAEPRPLLVTWLPTTVDHGARPQHPLVSALIDLGLIALFGLQHSLMARPWFKAHVMRMPAAFERCTYVHMANLALFLLIFFWHPIPVEVWQLRERIAQEALWIAFACGWLILLAGAWSFGIGDLLGLAQMREWVYDRPPPMLPLRTGWLYRWLRHPMYVGVLLGVWATPHMSVGHMLLALGLTIYVLIAVRYEERDLAEAFGASYRRWREAAS